MMVGLVYTTHKNGDSGLVYHCFTNTQCVSQILGYRKLMGVSTK